LAKYSAKLQGDLRLDPFSSRSLATAIYREVSALPAEKKKEIIKYSPVPTRKRLHQLQQSIAFNAICNPAAFANLPGLAYAHTVTLCYISVVYLSEALFDLVSKALPSGSTGKKCARYLRNNPVRAFRNAFAHGNWSIRQDGSFIDFWASKGSCKEPVVKLEVSQNDLVFWYSLARATGYAAFSGLISESGPLRIANSDIS